MSTRRNVKKIYVSKISSLTSTYLTFRLEKEEIWVNLKTNNYLPSLSENELEKMSEENIRNIAHELKCFFSKINMLGACRFYFNHEKSWGMIFRKTGQLAATSILRTEPVEEDDTDMIFKALGMLC